MYFKKLLELLSIIGLTLSTVNGLSMGGRREFGLNLVKTASSAIGISTIIGSPIVANAAIPMVTVEEFEGILKESYKSVSLVEFGGSKGEEAIVKLIDGTEFGISNLVESSTDPRSPLKLVSTCKGYGIPTKFTYLDSFLSTAPKRKKIYMNERLAEAAKKEEEKKLRMQEDEQARLKALYEMESDI